MHEYYSISELTREFQVSTRTLRFYEDQGLLKPFRRGKARLYTQSDRHRLQQILRAKRLNLKLSEAAELLALYDQRELSEENLRQILNKINKRRETLKQMRQDIEISLHDLNQIEEDCFARLAEFGANL